jgi:hypothetical protein
MKELDESLVEIFSPRPNLGSDMDGSLPVLSFA